MPAFKAASPWNMSHGYNLLPGAGVDKLIDRHINSVQSGCGMEPVAAEALQAATCRLNHLKDISNRAHML